MEKSHNSIIISGIVLAFIAGTITTGTIVFADTSQCDNVPPQGINKGKPFLEIWAVICDLKDQIDSVTAGTPVFFGSNNLNPNAIQFTGHGGSCIGSGVTFCEMVMPFDGTFTRLTLSSGTSPKSPGTGESYTATLLLNGASTSLSCTISGSGTDCMDSSNNVPVSSLDRIVVKVTSSFAANKAIVSSSAVFTP